MTLWTRSAGAVGDKPAQLTRPSAPAGSAWTRLSTEAASQKSARQEAAGPAMGSFRSMPTADPGRPAGDKNRPSIGHVEASFSPGWTVQPSPAPRQERLTTSSASRFVALSAPATSPFSSRWQWSGMRWRGAKWCRLRDFGTIAGRDRSALTGRTRGPARRSLYRRRGQFRSTRAFRDAAKPEHR